MVKSSSFRLDQLDVSKPLLYNQHALALAVSRVSKGALPTQLVYPDGSLAIGFPPGKITGSLEQPQGEERTEDPEDEEEQIRRATVLVHASQTPDDKLQKEIGRLSICMFVVFCFQALMIGWFATSYPPMPNLNVGVYTAMMLWHLLVPVGLLGRLPSSLALYEAGVGVITAIGLTFCLRRIWDMVVILSFVLSGWLAGRLKYYIMSHAFTVSPSSPS